MCNEIQRRKVDAAPFIWCWRDSVRRSDLRDIGVEEGKRRGKGLALPATLRTIVLGASVLWWKRAQKGHDRMVVAAFVAAARQSASGGRDQNNHYQRVTAISPRGQVTEEQFGNNTVESAIFDDSTGLWVSIYASGLPHETLPAPCQSAPVSMVKQLDYTYDLFTNLRSQKKTFYLRNASGQITCNGTQAASANATETYAYDDLQRLTGASRVWTGMAWQAPTTPSDSYDYDDLGNFKSKSDYADKYTYNVTRPDLTPLPHAVGAVSLGGVTKATFTYDANGNLTDGDGRHIDFDDFDRPVKITMGSVTTFFRYAPDGSRYLQQTTTSSSTMPVTKTIYYVGKYYERVDWSDGKTTEEHTYIGPSIAIYQSGSKRDVRYMHLDRLGSVEAVTNTLGAEVTGDAHSFDAFGRPRARDWQVQDKLHPNGDFGATTEHGFTGHEHLDDTYLIHMNGRVYDYRLGRFLSVDPIISGTNRQALNPYTYIMNNPFSGVDPTGYAPEKRDTPDKDKKKEGEKGNVTGSHIPGHVFAGSNLSISGHNVNAHTILQPNGSSNEATAAGGGNKANPTNSAAEKGGPQQVANGPGQASDSGGIMDGAKQLRLAAHGLIPPNPFLCVPPQTWIGCGSLKIE
jgi:RHS repeat-associated protein